MEDLWKIYNFLYLEESLENSPTLWYFYGEENKA